MGRQSSVAGWIVAAVVLVVLVAGGIYLFRKGTQALAPNQGAAVAAASSAATGAAPAAIEHPISQAGLPAGGSTAALPALNDSDASVLAGLEALSGSQSWLIKQQIARRIVATVDALPRQAWGATMLPARTPGGKFATVDVDGRTVIDAANAQRYAPYISALKDTDPTTLVAWYVREYPLFQQAYRELGYPKGYFNDRLIQAIDNLLAAPEPSGPIALVSSNGMYQYADPGLQSLSAGQKLMVRMGPSNEETVKARLRAVRAALTGATLPHGASPTAMQ